MDDNRVLLWVDLVLVALPWGGGKSGFPPALLPLAFFVTFSNRLNCTLCSLRWSWRYLNRPKWWRNMGEKAVWHKKALFKTLTVFCARLIG